MKKATVLQRFGAYVIDMILIIMVFMLFEHLVLAIVKIPQLNSDLINLMPEALKKAYEANPQSFSVTVYGNQELLNDYLTWTKNPDVAAYFNEYYSVMARLVVFYLLFALLEMFLYFVILPRYWSHQTIGRLFTKTKVITMDGEPLSIPTLLRREIVGGYLFSILNICCGAALIVNLVLVLGRNMTAGDMFAQTLFVRFDEKGLEENNNDDSNDDNIKEFRPRSNRNDTDIIIDIEDENKDA